MGKVFRNILDINKATQFVNIGFMDYIAARALLNKGLLLQGMILASTCIEKYLKAILILNKRKHHKHLDLELINEVEKIDPELIGQLNISFLELLIKCYRWRYIDNIPDNFNVALIQYPSLAELDYSVSQIEMRIKIYHDEKMQELGYRRMWKEKDPLLTESNYLAQGVSKRLFIESTESRVECFRIDPKLGSDRPLLAVTYTAAKHSHDGNFLKEFAFSDYPTVERSAAGFTPPFPVRFKK